MGGDSAAFAPRWTEPKACRRPAGSERNFLHFAHGGPWRDLPERYGPRTTVYNRYARWARRGVWKAIFDGLARRLVITGGQVHDGQVLPDLLEGAGAPLAVVADKAYGSRAIRQLIADGEALAVILSKSNAREPFPHDPGLYKMRNIVERFFCTMKDMRRLATRFEKLSRNFLAMIHIFAIRLWIN